jgi:hypothetical protein
MEQNSKPLPAALGFRVKSGWARAVLLAGPWSSPTFVRSQPALLSDPNVPATKQPYHAVLELRGKQRTIVVEKLLKLVGAAAERSVTNLLKQAGDTGYAVHGAALVVGSLLDPASLHNEHIRAHGLEGQLFQTVLKDAFHAQGIPCAVMLEKGAYARAARELRTTEGAAKRMIAKLGESQDGCWRAEEKLAALAAWMALTRRNVEE